MNGLDRRLHQAFRPKAAPTGFADRVLEQVDETRRVARARARRTRLLSRIAAVLLVGTISAGTWFRHEQAVQERKEAEEASALVKLALHIASEKTNIARAHLTGNDRDDRKGRDGNDEKKTND